MNEKEIINLIKRLSSLNESENEKIYQELLNINDKYLHLLVFTEVGYHSKSYWAYGVNVLVRMGYPRIEPVIQQLFEFFQDVNWPGTWEVFEFFKSLDKKILIPYIEKALSDAQNDSAWLHGLGLLLYKLDFSENDFSTDVKKLFWKALDEY